MKTSVETPVITSVETHSKRDALSRLALAAQQDSRKLGKLLILLEVRLSGMVYSEMGAGKRNLPADEVADIIQLILIAVWQNDLAKYDPVRGEFASFLRRRVRWSVSDAIRKRGRRSTLSLERQNDGTQIEIAAPGQEPQELNQAHAKECLLRLVPLAVERCLDDMGDAAAKAAVLGHDVLCRPLRDVAEGLGIHPSNATRARKRGLRFLERSLGQEFRTAA